MATKYNIEYKDIEIEEENFNWMNEEQEAELQNVTTILTPDDDQAEDNDR